jgi:hypothetical protein
MKIIRILFNKKMLLLQVLLSLVSVIYPCTAIAADYYVSNDGHDDNPGTIDKPFKTIQRAANVIRAGDVCYVREGIYRETVRVSRKGKKGFPIRFVAMPGEKVILDGREPVMGSWKKHNNGLYFIDGVNQVEQLFFGNEMMIEARWPNANFDQLLSRSVWATAGKGSVYGKIVDSELARTGVDWSDADVILNVAHQYYTWKRAALTVGEDSGVIGYAKDLKGLAEFSKHMDKPEKWEDDYYYLVGSLGLLDVPLEWYYDKMSSRLYFYPPKSDSKIESKLKLKVRDYAFVTKRNQFIYLEGFEYFATTVSIKNCTGCRISNSNFLFSTYTNNPETKNTTTISGNNNTILNSNFSHVSGSAISLIGNENVASELTVNDVSWFGTLKHPAVSLSGDENNLNKSILFDAGSVLVDFHDGANTIEFNNIYRGGLLSRDVALVYTQRPETYGSKVRYNWVHDIQAETGGGICIRGDDLTRGLNIHNNVVWNCGHAGIVIKGDYNKVYNNTILSIGGAGYKRAVGLLVKSGEEPLKLNRPDFKRTLKQNKHSVISNNVVAVLAKNLNRDSLEGGTHLCGNYHGSVAEYLDMHENKFMPFSGTPLIDAGCDMEESSIVKFGEKVDVGAYEYGLPYWSPGLSDDN